MSLPFISVSREVTGSWGWAHRGHRKEAEGSRCMCSVSYCWACGFSSPFTAKYQPQPQLGRQGQELLMFIWEHPNGLGSDSPTY